MLKLSVEKGRQVIKQLCPSCNIAEYCRARGVCALQSSSYTCSCYFVRYSLLASMKEIWSLLLLAAVSQTRLSIICSPCSLYRILLPLFCNLIGQ